MPVCANGHDSADDEFCDVCGLAFDRPDQPPAPAAGTNPRPAPEAAGAPCPVCATPLSGRFCEVCGTDSHNPPPSGQGAPAKSEAAPPPAAEQAPPAAARPVPEEPAAAPDTRPGSWFAVVSADRRHYDAVRADDGPDVAAVEFPPFCPERTFPLRGKQMSIGRRSRSRGTEPDIDLTGPPEDPGVSRLHAVLLAGTDGWSIADIGSANGTFVNHSRDPLPPNVPRPVADGDQIHVGAWTTLTLHKG